MCVSKLMNGLLPIEADVFGFLLLSLKEPDGEQGDAHFLRLFPEIIS
jgi:hypothetical protein